MSNPVDQIVYVVDDEPAVSDSISMLLRSVGLKTRCFPDPQAFLQAYKPEMPGCVLLDIRMPRMSGIELHQEMMRRQYIIPVIFLTGHGDIPMAVDAMRAGAADFVQKPFNDEDLIGRVHRALEQDRKDREALHKREEITSRWNELTPREQDTAKLICSGDSNKVVASKLGISDRTVEVHRARILQKMEARNLAHLVQMLASYMHRE